MGSDTYKQKIKLLRKDGKEYEESFIVKEVPSHPLVRSHLLKQGLYEREVKYYTEVFPLMEELIANAGINVEKLWPECIGCDPNQYVILEDLSRSGYIVHPLDKLMDLEHSLLCTTAIARLHALSIILVEQGLLNESPVLKQSYVGRKSGSIATAMKAHFSSLYNLFSQWGTEWKNLGKQLVDNADALLVKYSNICQPSSTSLNVLNHGDLWLGNIMFKYCKITGKPTGIKLIDYQLSHFTSYALDLHYILRISSKDYIYKKHYQQLLAIYRETVLNTFKQFNFQPTKPFPSLDEINKEIDCKKLYPLMVSVYISPRMYEKTRNAMTKELSVFQDKNLIEKLMDIDEYRIRIKEIFEPYLGCNLLE
ncbi:uncharacterized protein isoform X2 [Rhodnius prolixus]|uniref:CHK domain-containing protein n=2 Tax=Rhodnius prolixus TaxID=13249 RepID=T1HLA0_RHOPR